MRSTPKGNVMTSNDALLVEADREVRAVLDQVYSAWAANDADAFVAPYADTATAVLPSAFLADREAIRATMASLFAGDTWRVHAFHSCPEHAG
jgi:uncharacterized protein (TIGR02246 family)